MKSLPLELGERSYTIRAGGDLLRSAEQLGQWLDAPALLLVTDENVAPHHRQPVEEALGDRLKGTVVLPAGEDRKSLATLSELFDRLAEHRVGRDEALVALGGGVIGDLTGFAAACWHRGINFYQLPTTLLAQVDASVGGKTAVNHPSGKNLIGAFHQPRAVIADTDTLATLPDREFRSGLAEVVKHALIADAPFLEWLEARVAPLNDRDPAVIGDTVIQCCRIKAQIVAEDEREQGQRALLNFGHTFGHVIENATGYGQWLHGEAVAAGMAQAMDLSVRLGTLSATDRDRALVLMDQLQLPLKPPRLPAPEWLEGMARDKKATAAGIGFIILNGIGRASVRRDVPEATLEEVLAWEP